MSQQPLPDAPSTERNREPILSHLRRLLKSSSSVLEVGSGTGQHAVYFAPQLPQLVWQTSERKQHMADVRAWLAEKPAANLRQPIELDVCGEWPEATFDTVFTANTLHIMSAESVRIFFRNLPAALNRQGLLIVYGPVKIAGEYIGPGNAGFDLWLKERDPHSAIRDLEWLDQLAAEAGLTRLENNDLPANNQLLVWQRTVSAQPAP